MNTSHRVAVALMVTGFALTSACAVRGSEHVGLVIGKLHPCPKSPNCVSSQELTKRHYIDPLRFEGEPDSFFGRLRIYCLSLKRVEIVHEDADYMRLTFKSALFRFVDDVEFLLDREENLVHVRSASRSGYSDLGVNRKRIERIRAGMKL